MKPKIKKSPNNIPKENNVPKNDKKVEVIDFYRNLYTSMNHPCTKTFFESLGHSWIEDTVKDEKKTHPSQFMTEKGIEWKTCLRWTEQHDFFMPFYESVKQIMGVRREQRMTDSNPNQFLNTLPDYLEEYKRVHEWRQATKTKNDTETKQNITVIVPDYSKKEKND